MLLGMTYDGGTITLGGYSSFIADGAIENSISCTNGVQKLQWSFCYNPYFILTNKSISRVKNF